MEFSASSLTDDTENKDEFIEQIVPLEEVDPSQTAPQIASAIKTQVEEFAEAGVMLYIGESRLPKWQVKVTKEIRYKSKLLLHSIAGLGCLQHRGIMILRLYETESSFTTQLLFILYCLFESVLVVKPFAGSAANSG